MTEFYISDISDQLMQVFKNSFFIRVCRQWNELPLDIRESNTLSVFRKSSIAFF